MRILFVLDTMFPLGPAHQANVLARELADRGWDVHVAILHDSPTSQYRVPEFCQIHHLEIQKHDLLSWKKLQKLASGIQPEICHDWSCSSFVRAAIGDRVPLVVSFNGFDFHSSRKNLGVLGKQLWDRARKQCHEVYWIVNHESSREKLVDAGIDVESTSVIAPVAPTIRISHDEARGRLLAEHRLRDDSILVGAYAPLVPAMRLKDLIWATDLLTCVRDDIHFLLMGAGPQLSRLKRFLRTTEAVGHVHFLGRLDSANETIAGLNGFWHSHLHQSMPNGILSAMSAGVPVIGVLGEETESLLVHQTTGLGVNLGARDEFARWTKYLIEQPDSAAQLARQGREHLQELLPLEQFVQAFMDEYEQVCAVSRLNRTR